MSTFGIFFYELKENNKYNKVLMLLLFVIVYRKMQGLNSCHS